MNTQQPENSMNNGPESQPNMFYTKCEQLPLSKFINCLCDENLLSLVISGNPELYELQAAWIAIYTEFIELSDEPDMKQLLRLYREVFVMKNKKLKVEMIVSYLSVQWDEDFVNDLRKMNFRYKFDATRPQEYSRDLKMILTRITKWEIDIEIYESEIAAILDKNKGGKVDRVYFTKTLVRLGNYSKYRIDPAVCTVAEFLILKSDYITYCDEVKKANDASNKRR